MKGLKLANPLILSGSGGISAFPKFIDNRANVTASIFADQNITTTGSVRFNDTQITGSINVGSNKFLLQPSGSDVELIPSGNLDIIGNFGIHGDITIPTTMSVDGQLKYQELQTLHTSSSIIYPSGSHKFGDTMDDNHRMTGSLILNSNTFTFNDTTITGFRNDKYASGSSQTNPVTEFAARKIIESWEDNQAYIRKKFAKVGTFVSRNTASFNAITASAPSDENALYTYLPKTQKDDFMFFKNGMLMEYDALDIEQSGSVFLLKVNTDSIGYNLVNTDEYVAWGKFNP